MSSQYFDDDWYNDEADGTVDVMTDPFDGLTRRDQDIFFKVLDLIPDQSREAAMDYFLDHPVKIKAVVAGVKLHKKLLAEHDTAGLEKLLEEEKVMFQTAGQASGGTDDY